MALQPRRKIAIVGAGAGGVLLAGALARPGPVLFDVTLIGPKPGRGAAYGVRDDGLLLDTRAGVMSLDPGSPSGFVNWLNSFRPRALPWTAADFAPRRLFGDYLESRLSDLCDRTPGLAGPAGSPARSRACPSLLGGGASPPAARVRRGSACSGRARQTRVRWRPCRRGQGARRRQSRSIIDGLEADVATLGLAWDIDALADRFSVPAA